MGLINKNWNDLIKPVNLVTEAVYKDQNVAQIVAEPLERGFGITLGNAIRRVLLSSLQGSAITSLKVAGVEHEFTSIPGVKEDLTDIILNLKAVIVKLNNSEKKVVRINALGPCEVTARMIETGHDVEVLNPDHVICTLSAGFRLDMELTCQIGKGYVPATASSLNDTNAIGQILIDALYSPVKKVSYKVEHSRVGQVTDYDKLILIIETDGSISPEMALALSARILQDQLQLFITFDEIQEEKHDKKDDLQFDVNLLKKVEELELSVRSQNCLKNDNIVYLGDLVCKTEAEMLKTPNFGRKSLNELKEVLARFNLRFGTSISGWPPENLEQIAKRYEEPY